MDSRRLAPTVNLSSLPVAPTIVIPSGQDGARQDTSLHLLSNLSGPGGAQIAMQAPAGVAAHMDQQLQEVLEDIRRTMQLLGEAGVGVARSLGLPAPRPPAYHHTPSGGSILAVVGRSELGGNGAVVTELQGGSSVLAPFFGFGGELDHEEFLRVRRRNRTCLDDAVLRCLIS